jgi:pimeloyl-ACP methyl ester carboxylesterase
MIPTDTSTPTAAPTVAPTPTRAIYQEQIEVAYEDRVIRGTLVGEGGTAVVLAPMIAHSRSSWMPFAEHLATQGFTALAFDFPGSGASGEFSWSSPPFDVVAVIDFLRERGYERIVCLGASLGAFGCFKAAVLRSDLAGLVIIADGITATTGEEAATLLMPKLFVRGRDANDIVQAMHDVYQLVPTPKEFVTLSAPAHGTDLFHSDDKDEFRDLLVEFLESIE